MATTYASFAAAIVLTGGSIAAASLLALGTFTILSRLLQSARHVLFAGLCVGAAVFALHFATVFGWHTTTTWRLRGIGYLDVALYCIAFGTIALLCWIYFCKIQGTLFRLKEMESALQQQQNTLEKAVKKRTAQLRQLQLEELRQMYRFSELGHLGVILLHDMANHLTTLTLEIEDMQTKQSSESLTRVHMIIRYLDQLVESTRIRMQGGVQRKVFNIVRVTNNVVLFLDYKAKKAGVTIEWEPPDSDWQYVGDPSDYSQIIAIIINNAIDAYADVKPDIPNTTKRLRVHMERDKTSIRIIIGDWGKGIPKEKRKYLFRPFQTSKEKGFGVGLFIARQSAILNFQGTIKLNTGSDHTEFVVELPIQSSPEILPLLPDSFAKPNH